MIADSETESFKPFGPASNSFSSRSLFQKKIDDIFTKVQRGLYVVVGESYFIVHLQLVSCHPQPNRLISQNTYTPRFFKRRVFTVGDRSATSTKSAPENVL